ncbi:hypothetical protein C0993_006159, partial [Termitomyces sp. T159_Od127]
MSQSIAPDNVPKRSLSPASQDSALPVGKRQKETKELMSDELHHESDEVMKMFIHSTEKKPYDVIKALWRSVGAAEVSSSTSAVFLCVQTLARHKPQIFPGLKFLDNLIVQPISPGAIEATERSWGVKYRGLGSEALRQTILAHALDQRNQFYYAQAIPIVQSSGTGKSRTIDELGKTMLVIPLNLRPPEHTGKAVVSFLLDI